MSKFGTRLKEVRKEKGMSAKQIANELFVTERTVNYWEAGRLECNFDTLIKIAEILNTSTDYLLGRIDFEE